MNMSPPIAARSPSSLMVPERLSAIQPSRVSASRSFLARASRHRWRISRQFFSIDDRARGTASYAIEAEGWRLTFPILSFEPTVRERTGRIIGRAWDMMGALIEGPVSTAGMDELQREMPKLYEGRATRKL